MAPERCGLFTGVMPHHLPGLAVAGTLRMRCSIGGLALMLCLIGLPAASADEAADARQALAAGGWVALIRHALAPGPPGDPPEFRVDDCATQRNLDSAGRQQAVALGRAMLRPGIDVAQLLTSQWCRCRETADLMDLRPAEVFAPLGNLYGNRGTEAEQVAAMRARIVEWRGPGTLVMVSHGSTIAALTDIQLQQAEMPVVAPQRDDVRGFAIVGRIPPAS